MTDTRRSFLTGMGAVLAASTTAGEQLPRDDCEYFAARLAQSMKRRFGGTWRAEVNNDIGAVYVFNIAPASKDLTDATLRSPLGHT